MTTKINPNQINGQLGANQVVTVSNTNLPLATAYANGQTVNGVVLATGNQILLTGQVPSSDNGLYLVNAVGAPTKLASNGSNLYYVSGGNNAGQTLVDTSGGAGTGFSNQSSGQSGNQIVKTVSLLNGTLATAYANGQVVNGYTLVTGDLVLLTAQTPSTDNGLYSVNAAGAPTKIAESIGTSFYVSSGTSAGTTYLHSGVNTYVIQASSGGASGAGTSGSFTALLAINAAQPVSIANVASNQPTLDTDLYVANIGGTLTGSSIITVANNPNRILNISFGLSNGGAFAITTVTVNGIAATSYISQAGGTSGLLQSFYFLNPPTGAVTVAWTRGTAIGGDSMLIQSVYNAIQSAPAILVSTANNTAVNTTTDYNSSYATYLGAGNASAPAGSFTNNTHNTGVLAVGSSAVKIVSGSPLTNPGNNNSNSPTAVIEFKPFVLDSSGILPCLANNAGLVAAYIGVCPNAVLVGAVGTVDISGLFIIPSLPALSNGAVYVSDTGTVSNTPGTNNKKIGGYKGSSYITLTDFV